MVKVSKVISGLVNELHGPGPFIAPASHDIRPDVMANMYSVKGFRPNAVGRIGKNLIKCAVIARHGGLTRAQGNINELAGGF